MTRRRHTVLRFPVFGLVEFCRVSDSRSNATVLHVCYRQLREVQRSL